MTSDTEEKLVFGFVAAIFCTLIGSVAAWATSVTVAAINGQWLLLLADVFLIFPGVAHGVGVWFGVWH